MTPNGKKTLKIVGISLGVLAVVVGGVVVYFKFFKKDEEETDTNPYVSNNYNATITASSGGTSSPYSKYNSEDIKKMQSWLYWKGVFNWNKEIMDAISSTGGIDGVIGDGFKRALNEAIKQGYVSSIEDLYSKSKK